MTTLLTEAFQKASTLPEETQDQLAQEMIAEIEWENRWDKSLTESRDKLDLLAENALHEYKSGRTQEMGFDEL
jgi:ubiquinone biosynthesis protein Coq4